MTPWFFSFFWFQISTFSFELVGNFLFNFLFIFFGFSLLQLIWWDPNSTDKYIIDDASIFMLSSVHSFSYIYVPIYYTFF